MADDKRYHHGDLRRALVDETLVMLEEVGVDKVSLRQLAQRVGVSRAAPYHHFANKEALLAAAIQEGFQQVHARTAAAADGIDDPWDSLRASGRVYVGFALERPALYRLMMGGTVSDKADYEDLRACSEAFYDALRRRIRACMDTGETRHDDVELAAFSIWCGVHGFASLLLDGALERSPGRVGDTPGPALVDGVLDGLVYGLRVPAAGAD